MGNTPSLGPHLHCLSTRLARAHLCDWATSTGVGSYGQFLSAKTTFSHNVLFNGPRAGVNFNDGFGGGEMDCRLLQSRCKTTWSGSGKA